MEEVIRLESCDVLSIIITLYAVGWFVGFLIDRIKNG
jgi:hypothetical protein